MKNVKPLLTPAVASSVLALIVDGIDFAVTEGDGLLARKLRAAESAFRNEGVKAS